MAETHPTEIWVSVDVETSGPTPSTGSLLSIGACLVDEPEEHFYVEIRPEPGAPWSAEAEAVHRLSRDRLEAEGHELAAAMERFTAWIERSSADRGGGRPLFVGFNATFDWMFVADAFARTGIPSPFGISGLDLKAFYLGRHWPEVTRWDETARLAIRARYPLGPGVVHSHDALDDAREQADLARALRGPLATAPAEAPES